MSFDRLVEKAYREKKPMARSLKGPVEHNDRRPVLKVVALEMPKPKPKRLIWLPKRIRRDKRIKAQFS